jgi:hypothetical protein
VKLKSWNKQICLKIFPSFTQSKRKIIRKMSRKLLEWKEQRLYEMKSHDLIQKPGIIRMIVSGNVFRTMVITCDNNSATTVRFYDTILKRNEKYIKHSCTTRQILCVRTQKISDTTREAGKKSIILFQHEFFSFSFDE